MKAILTEAAQQSYSVQSYDASAQIEGVVIKDIPCFVDDGGFFMELGRFDEGVSQLFPEFHLKQFNYSQMEPGAIKAYHIHLQQEDIWFISPKDRLLLVLSDMRENSPTKGNTMRFVMGEGKSRLLYIPRGVAHGVGNLWEKPAGIIYMVNQQFDLKNPDEGRLPWDMLGKEIWEMTRG